MFGHTTRLSLLIPLLSGTLLLLLLGGCSTTKNLPKGEVLYVGIAEKKVVDKPSGRAAERALSSAESALNVPPNNSLFGSTKLRSPLPIGLWVYNSFVNDSTLVGKKIFDMFASEPVLISTVNPPVRSALAANILHEYGYFRAQVQDSISYLGADSLKARVHYRLQLNEPFRYDSVCYLPPRTLPDGSVLDHQAVSRIKKGRQFSLERILRDRDRIVSTLRNQGYYYYRPELITYQTDTMRGPEHVELRVQESKDYPAYVFEPWTIGDVTVLIQNPDKPLLSDTLLIDSLRVVYPGKLPVRKSVLQSRVITRSGNYYSQEREELMREGLSRLGAFSFVDIAYFPQDTLNHILGMRITGALDKPWDASLETTFKTKSNNYIGPGVNLNLGRRNLLGGGEVLGLNLYGSYEWLTNANSQTPKAKLHSFELGTDVTLTSPSILLPWLYDEYIPYPTNTAFSLSASMLNRAGFFRMNSVGLQAAYDIQVGAHKHAFSPLKLQYNYLTGRTELFNSILEQNPILSLSLNSQFIPQMSYTYTYDNTFKTTGNHHVWLELYAAQAGNLISSAYRLAGVPYSQNKSIVGVPFAQFIKGTAELRYTYAIDRRQSLAFRLGTGAIYSYGNSTVAPYSEQFYVGGANSIRAFTVRSIGPGRYVPVQGKYSFMDQSGDFKLELNAEYRFRITGQLHGALFFDGGNIWLLRPDENRPGASLQELTGLKDFLNQMALGTGLGVRYDLDFLVVRFDVGFGLHLPYETSRKGYYNIPKVADAIGLHFAVGYPF